LISSSSESSGPQMQARGLRSSTVIVHRVVPASVPVFLEWQRGITRAAEAFPGYQATEVYSPAHDHPYQWVIVIHFDNAKCLQDWLDSPERSGWTAKLPREIGEFQMKTMPSGFAAWFVGLVEGGERLPHWKVFLTVLLGLYPTAMLLTLFLLPHTRRFGLAIAMLIGNAASVAFLEWLGAPVIRLVIGPWLLANGKEGRVNNVVGTLLIVASLAAMAVLFHWIQD
jgi:antibiotic biosynthesis monooxygenase (ABM) superfamily enzyme